MSFLNRADAGRQLTDALRARKGMDTVVVGVIRGGVPVAAEIARGLDAPFDICVVRKLVVSRDGPVTIGAIAEGGATYFDSTRLDHHHVSAAELAATLARESAGVVRLAHLLRERSALDLRGRDVILVDDGVISGITIRAAAFAVSARGAHSVELAAPVGASAVINALRPDFDRITVLDDDPDLVAVGARYREFWPVADAEIVDLLEAVPLGLSGVAV